MARLLCWALLLGRAAADTWVPAPDDPTYELLVPDFTPLYRYRHYHPSRILS